MSGRTDRAKAERLVLSAANRLVNKKGWAYSSTHLGQALANKLRLEAVENAVAAYRTSIINKKRK